MTTTNEDSTIIKFYDHGEKQNGFFVVRKFDDKVAICLSLEENGDVEALIENEVVSKLLEALKTASTTTS